MRKPRVIVVAGLQPMADGGVGGQMAVASTLVRSQFSAAVDLVLLSSTMESVPPPAIWRRAISAAHRMLRFAGALPTVDCALIFAADGLSVVEKGVMCVLARLAGRGVVIRFSSGYLPGQCADHPIFERWVRLVLSSADVVVSQGPYWSSFFAGYPEGRGKIVEIPNGIAVPKRVEVSGRGTQVGPRIGFLGWIEREKGVFELLAAFEEVLKHRSDAQLVVAGGGSQLARLRAEVRSRGLEGQVWTPGWLSREDVFPFLRSLNVFVQPSHFEGLPNALIEAMTVGVPVIATRVGSIPDVVVDGISGFLVNVGDVETIADRVVRILDNPALASELGAAGLVQVARFDVDATWPLFVNAIDRAINNHVRFSERPYPNRNRQL